MSGPSRRLPYASAGACYSCGPVSSPREDRGHGYPDLKPLLDVYLAEVRDRLGTDVSAVALYGSVARGQARAASDIDLFVVHAASGLPCSRSFSRSRFGCGTIHW